MFKTKILADKISNLTDARYFSARCCDVICFEIPDINDVSKGIFLINSIKEWVAGPDIFIRTNGLGLEDLGSVINEIAPTGILVSFFDDYDPEALRDKFLIKEIIPEQDNYETLSDVNQSFDAIMLDTRNTGLLTDGAFLNKLRQLSSDFQIYIKSHDFVELLQVVESLDYVSGIGINGGTEFKTGLKSYEEIDELLDGLEG